jgi:hypothetical protein
MPCCFYPGTISGISSNWQTFKSKYALSSLEVGYPMADTLDKIIRRPEHVQVFDLYEHLSHNEKVRAFEGVDATEGAIEPQAVYDGFHAQGISQDDYDEAIDILAKLGYLEPTYIWKHEGEHPCPVYFLVTHKGLAYYHGMLADSVTDAK